MGILDSQNYISEKLSIKPITKARLSDKKSLLYKYFPKTTKELKELISYRIENEGENCNLNDIDVSSITDMSNLFFGIKFNGDISKWDVSNVTDMYCMFSTTHFNGDISKWNVSKVKNMCCMFDYAV